MQIHDTAATENEFLMTSSAARALGVSKETVLLWERQGKLPALKTDNGRRLFRRSDVDRLRQQRGHQEAQ
jgi:excisionase family DNA binding protein